MKLNGVTLIAFENGDLSKMVPALKMCLHYCSFDSVKLLSCFDMSNVDVDCEKISVRSTSYREYNQFMLGDIGEGIGYVGDYVDSSHMLFIHNDGFIMNPDAWTNEFLKYDYIGARWRWKPINAVGNGGFTLRSKKLLDTMKNIDGFNDTNEAEDKWICETNRFRLECFGIVFAPNDIADRFSVEDHHWDGEFGAHYIGKPNTDISRWKDINTFNSFRH